MLSEQEKTKIELEEKYRNEVTKRLRTKSKIDLIETAIKIAQGFAIIAGIVATYYTIQDKNKQQKIDTAKEFKKTFYEKQFQFYTEASEAAATLATEDYKSTDYVTARKQFYRLFWGRLGIVEDTTVEASMVRFHNSLTEYEQKPDSVRKSNLQQASLKIAHNASIYTINIWLDSTERKKYDRAN